MQRTVVRPLVRALVVGSLAATVALVAPAATAASPGLSPGCATIRAAEPGPTESAGQVAISGTFAAGEQIRLTPAADAGVSVATGGGGSSFQIVAGGTPFWYDVATSGPLQVIIGTIGGGPTSAAVACGVPPSVTITTPSPDGFYWVDFWYLPEYSCADGTNAVDTCVGAEGLDRTVGEHTYTVTATDSAGLRAVASTTYTVRKHGQTLVFDTEPPADAQWGHFPYFVEARSTAGLPVTISVDPASTGCAGGGVAEPFVGIALIQGGSCILHADQAGNDTYEAADRITQRFEVGRRASAVTTVKASKGLLGLTPTTFRAQLDAEQFFGPGTFFGGYVGQKVTFSIGGKPMCTATTVAVPGDLMFPSAVATCKATIGLGNALKHSYTATFAGDHLYLPSSAVGKLQ